MSSAPWTPPPEALAVWEEGKRKQAFFQEHRDEFARDYPDQFVGVKDGEVVVTAPDLYEFIERREALGLEARDVWSTYVAVTKRNYIL